MNNDIPDNKDDKEMTEQYLKMAETFKAMQRELKLDAD